MGTDTIIIQNASFIGFVDSSKKTIVYLQDNLRRMKRRSAQQEANLRGATLRVCNSKITAADYPEYKFEIIPIGVDEELFRPLIGDLSELRLRFLSKSNYNREIHSRIGIFVGALNEVKGWSKINEIIGRRQDIFFIVVSKYADGKCHHANSITFNQCNQSFVADLLKCADFFILGSPVETQCLAAIEAAMCDVPVIMPCTGIFMDMSEEDRNKVGRFGINLEGYIDEVLTEPRSSCGVLNSGDTFSPRAIMIKHKLTVSGMINQWNELLKKLN
jgi:glycosyltransferase involved in cell wall biosynthesis